MRSDAELDKYEAGHMTRHTKIIRRWNWWADTIVPVAAFGFAWGMGWGPWVAIGAAVAAGVITAVVRPRGPNRWTE
jgi:hypothetical protein